MATIGSRHIVALLLMLSLAIGAHPALAQQNETRIALVIGNASYPDAEAPLRDPVNNARALTDELRRSGFEVDVGENLTKEAMRAAFDRFYGKIKPGSTALVFFSGYGIQSDRQTYVIPVNAQIWTEAEVRRDGYSLDLVLGEMNKKGAAVKIAILDASRRNPFERRFRAVAGGLAPASVPKSTVVMYAAAPGAVARDGDRPVFVDELLKAIRAPGKIEEAFNRTMVGVSRATQGEQIPWFSSSLVEDFSFATAGRATPDPAPTPVERRKTSPLRGPILMPPCGSPTNRRRARERRRPGRISSRSIRPVATPSWRVRNLRLWLPLPIQPLRWTTLQSRSLIRKSRSIEMMLPLITSAGSSMHNTAIFLVQSRISTKLSGSTPKMSRV